MHQADALNIVRSALCQAVERLENAAPRLSTREIDRRMAEVGRMARDYDIAPVARLAECAARAHPGAGHRAALLAHLQRMEDAIGCASEPERASTAILASIAIRLR